MLRTMSFIFIFNISLMKKGIMNIYKLDNLINKPKIKEKGRRKKLILSLVSQLVLKYFQSHNLFVFFHDIKKFLLD